MDDQTDIKQSIRNWWAEYPMTYGYEHGFATYTKEDGTVVKVEIGTRDFFELADKTFYDWNQSRHNEKGYFGRIFDYEGYAGKSVLEVGCGMGCMAMNWANHGAQITAVDLNPVAIVMTKKRFEIFNLAGDIREADGEQLPFANDTFDYVYSWGVLHHSPNTKQSVAELYRVMKPGARAGVMLYHRHSLMFRFFTEYVDGFVNMESKFLNPLELASRYGDGDRREGNPHTWPVTKQEVYKDLFQQFRNVHIDVLGIEVEQIMDQWARNFGSKFPRPLLDACIRRWGWSLWITGEK
jgi:ubiquinone/menaquinone biosynthesis C-methylase UbiE